MVRKYNRPDSWYDSMSLSSAGTSSLYSQNQNSPTTPKQDPKRAGPTHYQRQQQVQPPKQQRTTTAGGGGGGDDLVYVASAVVDSGVQHHAKGEHDKALKAFYAALKSQQLTLPDGDHICVAHTLSNIGAVYLKLEKFEEATTALQQSLQMKLRLKKRKESNNNDDNSNNNNNNNNNTAVVTFDTLNNLGSAAYFQGRYEESIRYYQQSLKESYQIMTGDHYSLSSSNSRRDVADTLYNVGRIHLQLDQLRDAMVALNESLQISKREYGPKHIKVAETLELIGGIYLSKKLHDRAMKTFLDVKTITEETLGPEHPDVASSNYHIGLVYEGLERYKEAWESFTSAKEMYKRVGFGQNDRLKTVRRKIAHVERKIAEHRAKKDKRVAI